MGNPISRRNFLKKGAIAAGAVAAGDFKGIGGAAPLSGSSALSDVDPHVIVKLYPGRTEEQKIRLAEQIVKDVVVIMQCGEESVSVAIEEIKPEDWAEKVYKPDILNARGKLYKKPGYSM